MGFVQIVTICSIIAIASGDHYPPGYSYAKFSGPVSGPAHAVKVSNKHGHGYTTDYVAQPDYQFAYGVEDPKSKVSQNRKETRHGDTVHGEYSLVGPDGKVRLVKYTADKHNGFQAEVYTDGKIEGHLSGGYGGEPANQVQSGESHESGEHDDDEY